MSNMETVKAAHARFVRTHDGALPTSAEMVKATGMSRKMVTAYMRKLELEYVRWGGSLEPARGKEDYDARILRCYEDIKRSTGRPPTAHELNIALGYKRHSSAAHDIGRRMGLELTPIRKKTLEEIKKAPAVQASPGQEDVYVYGHRAAMAMSRILEIKRSGDPAARPACLALAGSQYGITDRVMIICPVCGVQKLIGPRMHPFYLRNQAGEAIFVDKEACTGRAL